MFVVEAPGLHGAPTQILLVAPAVQRLGLRTLCVLPSGHSDFAEMARQEGIEVIERRIVRFRNGVNPVTFLRSAIDFVPTILALRRLIQEYQVNVVYTSELHEFIGPVAAKLADVRVIWRIGNTERHGWRGMVLRWLVNKLADNVTPITLAVAESQFGPRALSDPRFSIISACVDLQAYRPYLDTSRVDQELGRRPDEVWICQVGNLYPIKGVEYYVEAAALVRQRCPRPVKFMQIGSRMELYSQYYLQIIRQIEVRGLKDSFFMLGSRQDVPLLLSTANMLVVSSISEGQSGVAMEAMACHKPVVATRVGGILEVVVDGETGILVPPRDPDALAEAMLALIQNPQLATQMGVAGRRRAEQYYGVETCARKLAELANSHSHCT